MSSRYTIQKSSIYPRRARLIYVCAKGGLPFVSFLDANPVIGVLEIQFADRSSDPRAH